MAAGNHGALLVLEDLHWADPETLTIVEYLADNLAEQRVLCLVNVRDDERLPGLALGWFLHARRVSRLLPIAPLDEQEVAAMAASCLGAVAVPDEVVAFAARADGVPFVVEELLAAALSSGALTVEEGRWRISDRVDAVVPLTCSESMRRRVARLGPRGRAVLLAAAVLGRRFDRSLLPAMTGLGDAAVLSALHEAVDAQIVVSDRRNPSFFFRHALSRDAVLAELFPTGTGSPVAASPAGGGGGAPGPLRRLVRARRRAGPGLRRPRPRSRRSSCRWHEERSGAVPWQPRRRFSTELTAFCRRTTRRAATWTSSCCRCCPWRQARASSGVATSLLARRRAEVHLRLARAAAAATRWDEAHELLRGSGQECAERRSPRW